MIKEFTIDPAHCTGVSIRREYTFAKPFGEATDEDLLRALKSSGDSYSISNQDHPEFTALRDRLEAEGYIHTERQWWNGDRVVKRFRLNGVIFDVGEQFPCSDAMSGHLKFAKKYLRMKGGHDA